MPSLIRACALTDGEGVLIMKTEEVKTNSSQEEQYALDDARRVKVLSPGALVAKRLREGRL